MKKDTRITQCSKILETSILNLFNVQDSMNMDWLLTTENYQEFS
jgi:hypothetical protein